MGALEARGAAAYPWGSAVSAIHALRVAKGGLAVLPHVAFRTLAYLVMVAPALIGTLLVAFWIWI